MTAPPGLDSVDGLQPAREPQVLNLLHDGPDVFSQSVEIFVEADDVAGVLGKLNVAGSGYSHRLLGVFSHRLGVEIDRAILRFEDLVFEAADPESAISCGSCPGELRASSGSRRIARVLQRYSIGK